ncbi:MAG: 3',5'-cyclic-nucleotide phosphodiesterase [Candidatus Rokubacteria bacterium]|nr:3',5'-cyclic-nucleotide phosphodiesterase [Candidatus Rokubacteria bacterium]
MKIRVLGCYGSEGQGRRPAAFLVNDHVLVDAGTVPGALSVEEQIAIDYALLSHAHLDHIVGLAFLTETLALTEAGTTVVAAATAPVVDALRTHAFNNSLWPDFTTIPSLEAPVLGFRTLPEGVESRVGELSVRPVAVDHTVPAAGFIIHDGETGFVYSGDTGPTEAIWTATRGLRGLRAVIVETAFPTRLDAMARASKHLTPAQLRREMDKIPPDLPLWIFHIKPPFLEETAEELSKINSPRIHILEQGKTYTL